MDIIKSNVRIKLTCEEDSAFIKVLAVLEEVAQDSEGKEFGYQATGGTHISTLYTMLNNFFLACE